MTPETGMLETGKLVVEILGPILSAIAAERTTTHQGGRGMDSQKQEAPGYTQESLRMLETEEGQSNAVFACFGSASQHAQLLEQAVARFLSVYNRVTTQAVSLSDFDEFDAKIQQKTMGWLLREMQKYVTFSDPAVAERLDTALERRNYLMHAFFLKRHDGLRSEAGRTELLSELVAIERLLDHARITLNAMRIAMCRALNISDPFAADYATSAG